MRPATNSMPVFIKDVRCSGRELGLLECSFNSGSSTSDHTKDVGVKCRKCKIQYNVYANNLQGIKIVFYAWNHRNAVAQFQAVSNLSITYTCSHNCSHVNN